MSDLVERDGGRRELRLGILLSRKFYDPDGREAGRVEELRARHDGGDCVVEAYVIGSAGLIERLGARTTVRRLLGMFGVKGRHHSAVIPWDEVDWSDPEHPRLRRPHRSFPSLDDAREREHTRGRAGGGSAGEPASAGADGQTSSAQTRQEAHGGQKERQQK